MAKVISNVLIGYGTLSVKYPVGGSYAEVGYTKDGVSAEYNASTYDVMVEESTLPINRVLTKEGVKFTVNVSESSLDNINKAMGGAVLAGSQVTIGGGALKQLAVQFVGTSPSGTARTITLALATATGNVAMKFAKEGETVVPMTFEALKPSAGDAVTIVDS